MDDFVALTALITFLTSVWDILEWLLGLPEAVFHGYRSLIRSGADAARGPCIFGATIVTVCPARSRKRRCRRIDT